MSINKVIYDGNTLIDLTDDTVDASVLLAGYTAHDRSGASITGSFDTSIFVLKAGDTMTGSLSVINSEITVTGATSAHSVNVQGSGGLTVSLHLAASGNHGIYSSGYASSPTATATASGSWIINRTSDNYVTIPKWASIGSSDVPAYFDSTGKPVACGILKHVYHLHNVDSRSIDYTPNQYLSDTGARNSLSYEFKTRTTISASGSSTFGNLFTVVPWVDSSGGYPFQLYGSADGTLAYRSSNSNGTGWNSWEKIFKSKRIYADENDIYYEGTKATYSMIHFINNTSDNYGNGISIGGGGQTIIGGGESASAMYAEAGTAGAEIMYIGNDSDVHIFSNMQNGWASRKDFQFASNGDLQITDGLLKITKNSNTVTIGSQNNGFCHIYNSADIGFIFNKSVSSTNGDLGSYTFPWKSLYLSTGIASWASIGSSGNPVYFNANGKPVSMTGSDIMNGLTEGTSAAQRDDYIICQYAGGGTTTKTYHRCALKNVFKALNSSDITTALGYTPLSATVTIAQGGTGATTKEGARDNLAVLGCSVDGNGYPSILKPDGTASWVRASSSGTGFIPYINGGAGSGHGYLGTSSWYWLATYTDKLNDYNMHPSTSTGTRNTTNTTAGTATFCKYGRVCTVSISVTLSSTGTQGNGKTLFTGLPKAFSSQYCVLQTSATSNYRHLVCAIDGSGNLVTQGDGALSSLAYVGQIVYIMTT